jgi:mono/diheme cytochrome c family protein
MKIVTTALSIRTRRLPALLFVGCLSLPFAAAADDVSGAALFANHCAACHGPQGEGDGPVAGVMQITVPNLRTLAQRNHGTFPADSVARYIDGREIPASHGDRQMPIWGDVFSAEASGSEKDVQTRIAAIVAFVKKLQY